MADAGLSQIRKVRRADLDAGAALSQGQVPIWWQAQHFRKVRCGFGGRRSTFARSGADLVAGAALSQGQARIWWQAHRFVDQTEETDQTDSMSSFRTTPGEATAPGPTR